MFDGTLIGFRPGHCDRYKRAIIRNPGSWKLGIEDMRSRGVVRSSLGTAFLESHLLLPLRNTYEIVYAW